MHRFALAFFASALLLTAGCGDTGGSQQPVPIGALSATVIAFGGSPVGMTSATSSITLTANTGSVSFSGVSIAGTNGNAFLATSNCPTLLVIHQLCTITVAFAPTATGPLSATLLVADSIGTSAQMVSLTGTGTATGPIASLSSTAVTFTSLPVGQASTQTVTLTNIGSGSLSLNGFTVVGSNATSFALSGTCLTTASLAANSPCYLTITYAPTITGSLNAVINVNDSAGNSPQVITLATH